MISSNNTSVQLSDHKTFATIFKLFYRQILFFASEMLSEKEAEDAVQEVFLKLWERRDGFTGIQPIKAFLYLAVKNRCLNAIKHHQVVYQYQKKQSVGYDFYTALHRIVNAEITHEVHQAMMKLPVKCRSVIHHGYFEELSNQEVADKLFVSINTVKTQKGRGLHLLRNMLHKENTSELLLRA